MQQHERSERSRRQILDAALSLFSRKGYGATSVREIGDAAGLSIGNVYHQFADKESIFQTLLDEVPGPPSARPSFRSTRRCLPARFPTICARWVRARGRRSRTTNRTSR